MKTDHPNPAKLDELRQVLKEKFSTAHRDFNPQEVIACGLPWIDHEESLRKGAICEISSTPHCCDGPVIIAQMLRHVIKERQRLVLIDGADSFDPSVLPVFGDHGAEQEFYDLDGSFIWARCRGVTEAVRVADMLLRDGNLPRTIIDLQHCPAKEIRSIPAANWLRLRSLTEDSGVSCIILTPEPMIACAAMRFKLNSQLTLDDLESPEMIWSDQIAGIPAHEHRPPNQTHPNFRMVS